VSLPALRFLHVANGTCTTDIIKRAGIPGRVSIWADVLYEGPVPDGLSDEELLHVRARFLAEPTEAAYTEVVNGLRGWRAAIDEHLSYDELVLWFEHDLFDQLNLAQLLTWINTRLPAGKAASLVCIGSFPGHPRFKGLGELAPDELASLLETRRQITTAQYDVAERTWRAFRQPTPAALHELLHVDTSALPFMAAAIRRFLEEYPSTRDGLSRTERRLLQMAGDAPSKLSALFPRMHESEHAYYVTDGSLAELAGALSRTSPPLISYTESADQETPLLGGTIALEELGRDVLAGRRDRIEACGIDRWLGGTHVQKGTNEWRWDEERTRIVRRETAYS
jgi:hypothetical protein